MKVTFVGHFAPLSKALEQASSASGNQVQRHIFHELSLQCSNDCTVCYAMAPQPYWPIGSLISRSLTEGSIEFIGYLNLPVLKHVFFSVRLFMRLLKARPQLSLQYNSYLLENLVLLLYRLCHSGTSIAIIIQDVNVVAGVSLLSKRGLRSLSERTSLRLSKRFDMIVPISSAIIRDFHFALSKCLVFQGGVTEFAVRLMREKDQQVTEVAVFAGALEPHNGIDRLVKQWVASRIEQPLHVFGRGSLESYVKQAARQSDRVVFHGFQPEQVVVEWQRRARWNFCLRYSAGINQAYFFPSKLFNILCAPGAVIVNDFHALPTSVRGHLFIVSDDLSNLAVSLPAAAALSTPNCVYARREIVRSMHSWRSCISQVIHTLSGNQMT